MKGDFVLTQSVKNIDFCSVSEVSKSVPFNFFSSEYCFSMQHDYRLVLTNIYKGAVLKYVAFVGGIINSVVLDFARVTFIDYTTIEVFLTTILFLKKPTVCRMVNALIYLAIREQGYK